MIEFQKVDVEKLLKEKGEQIKKEVLEEIQRDINFRVKEAEMTVSAFIEQLQKVAGLFNIPSDLFKVIAGGGIVYCWEHKTMFPDNDVSLYIRGQRLQGSERLTIGEGKYRIILIAEKLSESTTT
jgi:hypothetical protein